MTVVRAVCTVVALGGVAVALASPASAEGLSGRYDQYVQGSRQFTVLGTEQWPDPDTDPLVSGAQPVRGRLHDGDIADGWLDARDASHRRPVAVQPPQPERGDV
jgi:hypothetical protein